MSKVIEARAWNSPEFYGLSPVHCNTGAIHWRIVVRQNGFEDIEWFTFRDDEFEVVTSKIESVSYYAAWTEITRSGQLRISDTLYHFLCDLQRKNNYKGAYCLSESS